MISDQGDLKSVSQTVHNWPHCRYQHSHDEHHQLQTFWSGYSIETGTPKAISLTLRSQVNAVELQIARQQFPTSATALGLSSSEIALTSSSHAS